jgi:hypothetical protein
VSAILRGIPYKITYSISGLLIPSPYAVMAIRIRYERLITPSLADFKVLKSAIILSLSR